jgi:ribosomal-protein-alanine N-acetyltransferase
VPERDGDEAAAFARRVDIETERLRLVPFAAVDTDALHAVFVDADVRRFLLDDQIVPREWVEAEIAESDVRFAASGAGLWSIREPGTPVIVGFTGFRPFFDPPELQLLYGLRPTHWGHGFATEAARAALARGFELGMDPIVAAADRPNVASIRVMERLGMRRDRTTDDGRDGTVFYVARRSEWR